MLGNIRWDKYVRRQISQNTVDGRVTLELSKWDGYNRTQQIGQLLQKAVDHTLGQTRQDSYSRTPQIAHQEAVDRTVTL